MVASSPRLLCVEHIAFMVLGRRFAAFELQQGRGLTCRNCLEVDRDHQRAGVDHIFVGSRPMTRKRWPLEQPYFAPEISESRTSISRHQDSVDVQICFLKPKPVWFKTGPGTKHFDDTTNAFDLPFVNPSVFLN